MSWVRSHLRVVVALWLTCHVATFASLVACDCCAMPKGQAAASASPPCHESAPPPDPPCEHMMHDGAACPMHRAHTTAPDCAMSGACAASGAMVHAVLLQPAVLVSALTVDAPLDHRLPPASLRPSVASLTPAPDSPPPRL